jgi:surfactin synthase thioesterase subunit
MNPHEAPGVPSLAGVDHSKAGLWFVRPKKQKQVKLRLFCFPYAGGGPMVFSHWPKSLPNHIEVSSALLPGRHTRLREKPVEHWPQLIDSLETAIEPALDCPFVFFGHSFGGRIAYELAKRLQQQQKPMPAQLIISASRSPNISNDRPLMHDLPQAEFIQRVIAMKGTPAEVLDDKSILQIMEPMLRADIKLAELWGNAGDSPVDIPIAVFAGARDTIEPPEQIREWARYTHRAFTYKQFPGDHFFIHSDEAEVMTAINALLAPLAPNG